MAVEDVVPSARRGIKLIDTVMAVKDAEGKPRFNNMDEFQRFLQKSGMPMIGQTGGEASLELLNSMVEPKDRYIKISPDYQKMEEATLKTKSAKIKKVEGPKTAEKILTISAEAESKFPGKMTSAKKSFIERALKQANIFIDDAAKLGFKSLLGATGPIGATIAATIELATAPKAEGPRIAQEILTIGAEAESKFPGEMTKAKKSFIEKALKQANIFIDDAAKLGFKSMLGATGPIGATIAMVIELATAPKAEAKEVMQKRSMEDEVRARLQEQGFGQTGPSLLTQMQNDPQNIGMANGGVASIFNMTKPIGR